MAEQWLSIVEYARAFRMSDMTVRRRIKTGKLNATLHDGKYYIPTDMAEVRTAAAQSPQGPAHPPPSYGEARTQPAPPRSPGEMTVIKGRPPVHRPQPQMPPQVEPRHHHPAGLSQSAPPVIPNIPNSYRDDGGDQLIPASLRMPLQGSDAALVDTRALLAFCDATLKKLNESERRTVEKFKSKLEALEAEIRLKDKEIKILQQKNEDLQVLVRILESKK
jgi:hypothetical protein